MPSQVLNAFDEIQKAGTTLIVDSANFHNLARFKAAEATTNPSIIYAAAQKPEYDYVLARSVEYIRQLEKSSPSLSRTQLLDLGIEHLAVQFGTELYKITGGISTQVEVIYSFSVQKTVDAALRLIELYKAEGVPKSAIRIKISATWEGIQAARILESEHDVRVLITVVFGLSQVAAAAEAGVSCVAPYVGRIGDWYKAAEGVARKDGLDMGVERVKEMQNYLRKHGYRTKVMGASFRTTAQAIDLAGADYLTISPTVLDALKEHVGKVSPQLTAESATASTVPQIKYSEDEFRWAFNSDACAVEKSADAIRRFAADSEKLKGMLADRL
ncbi:transaldolase [Verruconis gallopava]|uniref:Transaldolase n=1 Tax=Verruconis gallopava TaxID=253628 RepID=A0A0D2AVG8_9PEZI|nr:transaldolase [Verruconis gallopava]KIW03134.1 transaldolase [Verruconis gallopava]